MKILLVLMLLSTQVLADEKRTIAVKGECSLKAEADRGSIDFSVEHTYKDASKASKRSAELGNILIDRLKKLGLDNSEVSTRSFSVNEESDWVKGKRVFKGYKAVMSVTLETSDIKGVGKAISLASGLGVKRIGNLNVFLSSKMKQSLSIKCLDQASNHAMRKAKKLAKKLDARVGKVLHVREGGIQMPSPQPVYRAMRMAKGAMMESAGAPQISAKSQKYEGSVHFEFEID